MSTLVATVGLIWLSLIYIIPKLTRGNVAVSEFSVSLVPPGLVASMSVLMLVCGVGIVAMFAMCLAGMPLHLPVEIVDAKTYLLNELVTNLVASTAAIVLTNKLAPTLIMVASGRWAVIAGVPIAVFLTAIGLISAAPVLA